MMGLLASAIAGIRGLASSWAGSGPGRRVLVVGLVVLLVGLSGYMAAGGVTVGFSLGLDGSAATADAASGPADEVPPGIVTEAASEQPDADGDGVTGSAERQRYGTDPAVRDTDGDGITDGMEIACTAAYPDADPLRQDVYVEVDSVEGVSLNEGSAQQLRTAFAEAPVSNPNGESGIALHLVRSDGGLREEGSVNDDPRQGAYNDVQDYREAHFQHQQAGYYYLLVSTDVAYRGDPYYAGAGEPGTAIVESYDRDGVMSSLVLHELGHAFGIDGGEAGVDGREYTKAEYASVMNYNALYELTSYSDGTDDVGRNEWAYVANDRHTPTIETGGGLCPAAR